MKLRFMDSAAPLRVLWPVKIDSPADNGEVVSETVHVRFEIIAAAEAQALLSPPNSTILENMMDGTDADTTLALLKRVVVGWNEVEFGGPFSDENFANLTSYPFARNALVKAYTDAAQGRRAKN